MLRHTHTCTQTSAQTQARSTRSPCSQHSAMPTRCTSCITHHVLVIQRERCEAHKHAEHKTHTTRTHTYRQHTDRQNAKGAKAHIHNTLQYPPVALPDHPGVLVIQRELRNEQTLAYTRPTHRRAHTHTHHSRSPKPMRTARETHPLHFLINHRVLAIQRELCDEHTLAQTCPTHRRAQTHTRTSTHTGKAQKAHRNNPQPTRPTRCTF